MERNRALALYIHIPFCAHICDYCDFTKLQYFTIFAKPYLKVLKQELDSYHINHQLETIYVGGGTPTSLEDDLFLELLEMIDPYTKGVKEYTFECNPESLSLEKLQMMKAHGVNRLSIGVESTDETILKNMNRHHTFEDVKVAISRAKECGYDNLNVDLILGVPGSNMEQLKKDLVNLVSLDVTHISCYSLTVNPNTVFFLKGVVEPSEEESRENYDLVNEYLEQHGFIHYEISNWCKPGRQSLHNFTYWKNNRYYGVGLGASGYLDNYRYTNTKSINKYLKGECIDFKEEVSIEDDKEYQIMLNLRTNVGIDLDEYKDKFGEDLYNNKKEIIDEEISRDLLILKKNHLIATYQGMMVLDSIVLKLISQ